MSDQARQPSIASHAIDTAFGPGPVRESSSLVANLMQSATPLKL